MQDKEFLKNLTTLGSLYTYNSVQDKEFLKNLTTLGSLDTSHSVQDKEFLKNVNDVFSLPLIYADGILSVILATKIFDKYTIHATNRYGHTTTEYIATDGKYYAHAKSAKLAISDLRFKKEGRDTTWLEDKTLDSVLPFEDMVIAYRAITGACSGGVEGFVEIISPKEKYSIREVIELTKNQYQSNVFKNFFNKK